MHLTTKKNTDYHSSFLLYVYNMLLLAASAIMNRGESLAIWPSCVYLPRNSDVDLASMASRWAFWHHLKEKLYYRQIVLIQKTAGFLQQELSVIDMKDAGREHSQQARVIFYSG